MNRYENQQKLGFFKRVVYDGVFIERGNRVPLSGKEAYSKAIADKKIGRFNRQETVLAIYKTDDRLRIWTKSTTSEFVRKTNDRDLCLVLTNQFSLQEGPLFHCDDSLYTGGRKITFVKRGSPVTRSMSIDLRHGNALAFTRDTVGDESPEYRRKLIPISFRTAIRIPNLTWPEIEAEVLRIVLDALFPPDCYIHRLFTENRLSSLRDVLLVNYLYRKGVTFNENEINALRGLDDPTFSFSYRNLRRYKSRTLSDIVGEHYNIPKWTYRILLERPLVTHVDSRCAFAACRLIATLFDPNVAAGCIHELIRLFIPVVQTEQQVYLFSNEQFTLGEQRIIVTLLKTQVNPTVTESEIRDHLLFRQKLRPVNIRVPFNSQLIHNFHREHLRYAKLVNRYTTKPDRPFHNPVIDNWLREHPFRYRGEDWAVHWLQTRQEYQEEGIAMNHCVAGYVDDLSQHIWSLRNYAGERITCAVAFSYAGGNPQFKSILLRQAKGLGNGAKYETDAEFLRLFVEYRSHLMDFIYRTCGRRPDSSWGAYVPVYYNMVSQRGVNIHATYRVTDMNLRNCDLVDSLEFQHGLLGDVSDLTSRLDRLRGGSEMLRYYDDLFVLHRPEVHDYPAIYAAHVDAMLQNEAF